MATTKCYRCAKVFTQTASQVGKSKSVQVCKTCKRLANRERYEEAITGKRIVFYRATPNLKKWARLVTRSEIKKGNLVREVCKIEGCEKMGQAHHLNYEDPKDIEWLCDHHHAMEHVKLG